MDRMNPPRRLADVWLLSHHQALIVPLSSDLKGGSTSTRRPPTAALARSVRSPAPAHDVGRLHLLCASSLRPPGLVPSSRIPAAST
jgi:hypothetical protein